MKSGKDKYLERIRNLDRRRGYLPDSKSVHFSRTSKPHSAREDEEKHYALVPIVLARDNYTCQWCGKAYAEDAQTWRAHTVVHHLDGNRLNNNVENLITICRSCHQSHHGKTETKEKIETDRWRRNYYRLKRERKDARAIEKDQ